ncbi:hypothetical protein SO802_009754 [Lithocarpus litseifolius]|uniref:Uncharacterized protein n=1 Tax=Lithocarpus litseifolius TaxID=425828 RepID=A0AAW2DEG5_9ROSI
MQVLWREAFNQGSQYRTGTGRTRQYVPYRCVYRYRNVSISYWFKYQSYRPCIDHTGQFWTIPAGTGRTGRLRYEIDSLAFNGNRPLIVEEFLYCYKPSEISQSLEFYQFSARGSNCRLIRCLPSFDRRWKKKFFFVSGYWAGNPIEVGRDTFPPYIDEIGRLCSQGKATMKENKGKGHVSGDEAIQTEALKPILPVSSEKRKKISKTLDTGNLPSCQGKKKPKLGSFTPSKPPIVKTNPFVPPAASNQLSTANTPLPDASPSLNLSAAAPLESRPLTFLRSEGLAWDRFQQAMTDKDITICYDMFVKEFE